MNLFIAQFVTVIVAHLLAVMSPGPDFVVVSKNSLSYSRKIGVFTALGVALGICVHVAYSLLGIGFLISKSIFLFNLIKILGAGYLLYLGYKMIRSKPNTEGGEELQKEGNNFSAMNAIKNGFFVNVLNPKATLFFLALFTQIISPETSTTIKLIFGAEMTLMTFIWFTVVSYIFSSKVLRTKIFRFQHIIDRCTGVLLIAIGLKVIVSR